VEDGLIMIDGTALTREEIEDLDLRRRPFVFLNACQTGRESESLGDYAGLAQAFLVAGASGVIAPRWAINDGVARSLAVRFYDRVRKGERPAEVMRQERRRFQSDPPPRSSTWMSYVFYGHPQMEFLGGGKAP
jgi:CHAT domain-containing protein